VTKEVALKWKDVAELLPQHSRSGWTLVNGHSVLATIAGKMRKFRFAYWREIA